MENVTSRPASGRAARVSGAAALVLTAVAVVGAGSAAAAAPDRIVSTEQLGHAIQVAAAAESADGSGRPGHATMGMFPTQRA